MALFQLNYWLIGDVPLTFSLFGRGDWKNQATFQLLCQLVDLNDIMIEEHTIPNIYFSFTSFDNEDNAYFALEEQSDSYVKLNILVYLSYLDDLGYNILHIAQDTTSIISNCRSVFFSRSLHREKYSIHIAKFIINRNN